MENRSSGSRRDRARMKCLFFIVLFLPVVYSQSQAECGTVSHACKPTRLIRSIRSISGGEETCSEMQPWHALIKVQGYNSVKCGGVLITERHVLSAAHCYWSNRSNRYNNCPHKFFSFTPEQCRADYGCTRSGCIRFGEHDILVYLGVTDSAELGYGEVKTIKKLDLHPGWVKETKQNGIYQGHDLAVLTLRSRVDTACTHIMPICLPLPSVIGKMAYVVGFRFQSSYIHPTTRLKKAEVQIMECENRAGNQNWPIRGSQVCALGEETDEESVGYRCIGDSGGGLYYFDASNNRTYLLGITSFGEEHNCGLKGGRPDVYSNVYDHKDWIADKTNTESDESDDKCSKPIQKDGLEYTENIDYH